jgi:outer membrane protein
MKMKNKVLLAASTLLALNASAHTIAKGASFGIVDFSVCIAESKYGKKEQESFESLRNQIQSMLEDAEKQLNEVSAKLQDQDYLDGLSPEAEQELKMRYQALNEEMMRYQNQYYQVLNQAHMRLVQTMGNYITVASQETAKELKIPLVVSKEAAFYYDPSFDMTQVVIERMNKDFDVQAKKAPQTKG